MHAPSGAHLQVMAALEYSEPKATPLDAYMAVFWITTFPLNMQ